MFLPFKHGHMFCFFWALSTHGLPGHLIKPWVELPATQVHDAAAWQLQFWCVLFWVA